MRAVSITIFCLFLFSCRTQVPQESVQDVQQTEADANQSTSPEQPSEASSDSQIPEQCRGLEHTERVEIAAGETRRTPTGLTIVYRGSSHDNYDDGSTDVLLDIELGVDGQTEQTEQNIRRMPSAFARPQFQFNFGHCWQIVEASGERIIVEYSTVLNTNTDQQSMFPNCNQPEERPSQLTSFISASENSQYWINVISCNDSTGWCMADTPRMPMHHSSRIEWNNINEFPQLHGLRDQSLRFAFTYLSRDIEHVTGQHRWRATYFARIDNICIDTIQ